MRWMLMLALVLLLGATSTSAAADEEACDPAQEGACALAPAGSGAAASAGASGTLLYFWGIGCPHCEEAAPFVDALAAERPGLAIERIEVRRDAAGRARFLAEVERLGLAAPGVPTFVFDDHYVVGYRGAETQAAVRALLDTMGGASSGVGEAEPIGFIDLPIVGTIDPRALSLPALTLLIGLVDGINPCAMWVLLVLMSILLSVQQRRRIILFGASFVLMSGVVYFLFMTVWVGLFALVGMSRPVTVVLGVALLAMGLINVKELVWFKRGVSLVIPDKAKPGLFRRMRGVARAASLPAALTGIVALAFVVNLIELGCTLGLPAPERRPCARRAIHATRPGRVRRGAEVTKGWFCRRDA